MNFFSKRIVFFVGLIFFAFTANAKPKTEVYEHLLESGSSEALIAAMKADSSFYRSTFQKEKNNILLTALKFDRENEFIKTILKSGVSVKDKNQNGQNAIIFACRYSSKPDVLNTIFSKFGNESKIKKALQTKDKLGKNALDYVKENSSAITLEYVNRYFPERKIDQKKQNPVIKITQEDLSSEITSDSENSASKEDNENLQEELETKQEELPNQQEEIAKTTEEVFAPQEITPQENSSQEETKNATEEAFETELNLDSKEENKNAEQNAKITLNLDASLESKKEELSQTEPEYEEVEATPEEKISRYSRQYLYDYAIVDVDPEPEAEPEDPPSAKIKNPDAKDKDGRTALMYAAKDGNDWEITSLLTSGANVNLSDNEGWTPLMYALRYQNNAEIVTKLLSYNADSKVKNRYGSTPLQIAAMYTNNPAILKKIISASNPTIEETFKAFILSITAGKSTTASQKAKLSVFIDQGIPLNRYYEGRTPLMYAAEFCSSTEILKLLIENDARPEARSSEGKTAFDYAKNNSRLIHDDIYWSLNNR